MQTHDAEDMLGWDHGGGFSLDASVRIEATDRPFLEFDSLHLSFPGGEETVGDGSAIRQRIKLG